MRNLLEIKNRIKSITETKKITNAMEMISISKMRKSLETFESNKQYFYRIRSVMKDIILHTKFVTHRYLQPRKGNRCLFIVIASDKGLAGGYNHNVLTAALKEIEKVDEKYILTLGQVSREFFQKRNMMVDIEFTHLMQDPTINDAVSIVDSIIQLYDNNLTDKIYVVYTEMINSNSMSPKILQLLPLEQGKIIEGIVDEEEKDDYYFKELLFDPSPDEVLAELVPLYLGGIVYGTLVQSVASEHCSRRIAMSNATKNAGEILDELKLDYNRARQEAITNEMTEIVTSASIVL